MDEKTFVDAVFAYFGEDAPTPDLLEILKERCEPTQEELGQIAGSFDDDASEEDTNYATEVMIVVGAFNDNPDDYIATLHDDDPRKVGLVAIAAAKKARDSVSAQAAEPPPATAQPPAEADAPQHDKAPSKRRPAPVDLAMSGGVMTSAKPIVRTTPIDGAKPDAEQAAEQAAKQAPKQGAKPDADSDLDRKAEIARLKQAHADALAKVDLDRKAEIAKAVPGDAVTQAHRVWLARSEWITLRDSIIRAFTVQDNRQLKSAQQAADGYKAGQRGDDHRLLGQLMEMLMADMEAGLPVSNTSLFTRRYWV